MMPSLFNKVSMLVIAAFLLAGCAANTPKPSPQELAIAKQKAAAELAAEQARKRAEEQKRLAIKREFQAATGLMKQGLTKQAESLFKAISVKMPESAGVWVNLGILAEKRGDVAQATQLYTKALTLNPYHPVALNNLGLIKREEGKFDEAKKLYEKGLSKQPKDKNLNYNLAVLNEIYLNQPSKAIQYYENYISALTTSDKKVESWLKRLKRKYKKQLLSQK